MTDYGTTFTANNRVNREYKFVIEDRGECSTFSAASLLSKTLGYSDDEALSLVNHLPAVVAEHLTYQQAAVLSKACDEYGMTTSVIDENEQEVHPMFEGSVFDDSGNLLVGALAAFGTISAINRITMSWARPRLWFGDWGRPLPPRGPRRGFGGPMMGDPHGPGGGPRGGGPGRR